MKYMLLMYAAESQVPQTREGQQAIAQEWGTLLKEEQAAGILLANNGLLPVANATSVRVRNGKMLTTDGPFAETHEQLGGFQVIECKDIDEALAWAGKIPHAKYGTVEVRPLWVP